MKAGEFEDELLEIQIGTNFLAYSQKIVEQDSLPNSHQLLDGVLPKATGLYPVQKNSTMLDNFSQDDNLKDASLLDKLAIRIAPNPLPVGKMLNFQRRHSVLLAIIVTYLMT